MKISLTYELVSFLCSIIAGIVEGILFDIFKIVQVKLHKKKLLHNLFDFLFWIFSGICFVIFVQKISFSELRGYIFVGLFIGIILYFLLISNVVILIINTIFVIFEKIFKIFQFFFKILLTPARFLYKIIVDCLYGKIKIAIQKNKRKKQE